MRPPGQRAEHLHRFGLIARLSEYLPIDNDRCVCCEHRQLLATAPDHKRLLPREADHVIAWSLPRQECFVDVRARNQVRHAYL
jgi:hypothetical protein